MYLEYLGHSCFYLRGKDISVVTDPFGGIGIPLKRVDCDYVLSSHSHFDHNNFSGVNGKTAITATRPPFTAIKCFHDEAGGAKRGVNNAFYFEIDGLNILHLGDLGEPFGTESAKKFKLPVDILFIPVGGNYTIDGASAAQYAKFIGAKVTVPMHYKTRGNKVDISDPREFLSAFEKVNQVENGFEINGENIGDFMPITYINFDIQEAL